MRFFFITLLCLGFLCGCGDGVQTWPKVKFEQKRWNETEEKKRFIFVRDLIENKTLIGKNKLEIRAMLGKPEHEDGPVDSMVYYVKQGQTDLYFLDIRFNSAEPRRADEAFVRSD